MSVVKEPSVPVQPPALTAPAIRAHRRVLEEELAVLKADVPAALLAAAQGDQVARAKLSDLRRQMDDIAFQIDRNADAVDLARKHDEAACEAWRTAVQGLSAAEAVEGITGGSCATRCLRGVPSGCVLAGGCIGGGAECFHPHQQRDRFHRDEAGRRMFPLRYHARASELFDEACSRIKMKEKFV